MSNFTLIPAGPAMTTGTKSKPAAPNTYAVPVANANVLPVQYPQYKTTKIQIKKQDVTVVLLELPADQLRVPKFDTWQAFEAEAVSVKADPHAKALDVLNDWLAARCASIRRRIVKDWKSIPDNPVDGFASVASEAVKELLTEASKANSAKAINANVMAIVGDVDMTDPAAMAAALAAIKASMGMA